MARVFKLHGENFELPKADNSSEALKIFRAANEHFRRVVWPSPYNKTTHQLGLADARDLNSIADKSVHLIVTSPPYWTLKQYEGSRGQLGDLEDYEEFLVELDKVWGECERVLVPGGRVVCVVGDVCVPRKRGGRHYVMPLHADIQVRSRSLGLDVLTPILWHKIANGVTEAAGNGAGFYGKPYQPGAVVKNDIEYILFMRKGGEYRKVEPLQKALSMLTKEEMQAWWRSVWTDIRGASTRAGHPAPYPPALAERLIRMFSFAGDTVLDPFGGTGSTSVAAVVSGRNSISLDIEPTYIEIAQRNLEKVIAAKRETGAVEAKLLQHRTRKQNMSRGHGDLQASEQVSRAI
ncbi:site-specific DNA-methyltransferase [Parasphingopyxis algicola]|uniref:DNA-methyltransferase n=1 Tax=Parasphingopyxis algicola TaxID=2026624 RepID=UPI0015A32B51|nr:site-specific DNA-methyltransferase [Parasphingopyxis algicola]QLC23741.1 site-specific DNA-methyltransferase [Parasphingopyxis algicola]